MEIADQFKKGDRKLAAAIDAALIAAREEEARAWRQRLAAAVVECGTQRLPGPYHLIVSQRTIEASDPAGELTDIELPGGNDWLLTYKLPPDRPTPKGGAGAATGKGSGGAG